MNIRKLNTQDSSIVGKYIPGQWNLFLIDTADGAISMVLPDCTGTETTVLILKLKTGSNDVTITLNNGQTADTLTEMVLTDPGDVVILAPYEDRYEVISVTRGLAVSGQIAAL